MIGLTSQQRFNRAVAALVELAAPESCRRFVPKVPAIDNMESVRVLLAHFEVALHAARLDCWISVEDRDAAIWQIKASTPGRSSFLFLGMADQLQIEVREVESSEYLRRELTLTLLRAGTRMRPTHDAEAVLFEISWDVTETGWSPLPMDCLEEEMADQEEFWKLLRDLRESQPDLFQSLEAVRHLPEGDEDPSYTALMRHLMIQTA